MPPHTNKFFYFSTGHCYFVYELEHNFSSSYRVRRLSLSVPFHLTLSLSVPCSVSCSHLRVKFHIKPHFLKLLIFTSSSSPIPIPSSWHQVCGRPAAPSPTDLTLYLPFLPCIPSSQPPTSAGFPWEAPATQARGAGRLMVDLFPNLLTISSAALQDPTCCGLSPLSSLHSQETIQVLVEHPAFLTPVTVSDPVLIPNSQPPTPRSHFNQNSQ